MALGKLARAKSLPQTKNRGQPLTLTARERRAHDEQGPSADRLRFLLSAALAAILSLPALEIVAASSAVAQGGPSCNCCGCKGGPGYRSSSGQCVGWNALNETCGVPATAMRQPIREWDPATLESSPLVEPSVGALTINRWTRNL
jgi:hypothetical protein